MVTFDQELKVAVLEVFSSGWRGIPIRSGQNMGVGTKKKFRNSESREPRLWS